MHPQKPRNPGKEPRGIRMIEVWMHDERRDLAEHHDARSLAQTCRERWRQFRHTAGTVSSSTVIKIIAGEFRSRILEAPEGEDVTRPMMGRVKEAIFNHLRGRIDGARILDLFAGVGTMGLECVSRGAAEVVMVERDRTVHKFLDYNCKFLGVEGRATAVLADALGPVALARAPKPVDIVFLDPPYALMEDPKTRASVLEQAARTRELFASSGFLVLRSPIRFGASEEAIPGFHGPEVHQYAKTMFVLLYSPKRD